MFTEHAWK